MHKPVILITCVVNETHLRLHNAYFRAVVEAGGLPLVVPSLAAEEARELAACSDGLLLTGGGDFDPALFGQLPMLALGDREPARDALELALINEFWRQRLPILGICRGMQALAIARGGSLFQDIRLCLGENTLQHSQADKRTEPVHQVRLLQKPLTTIFASETLAVNSLHHQSVAEPGKDLLVAARSEDGVIEALVARGKRRWCVGVQWHPESLPAQQPLFVNFIDAAAERLYL